MLGADLTGPQSSAADPPANRLRVAPGSASGFWDGKHVVRCYNIPPLHPSASPLGLGGLSRELPTQERNVERWLGDRDRRELEPRRLRRGRAEIRGRRGQALIGIGPRPGDLDRRVDRLTHRHRAIAKLVAEAIGPDRVGSHKGHEERPRCA